MSINAKHGIIAIALLMTAPLCADEVRLKGGGKITGQIVEETADTITVDIGAGKMTVKRTSITGIDTSASPLQVYRERAKKTPPNDIEAWRSLARWANEQGLSMQAHDAYAKVKHIRPDDEEANRSLGLVLHQGQWVSEAESYEARGFVKFENEWMSPDERAAIVRERDARVAENRSAVAAVVKESEAHRKQLEDEENRREEEESRRNRLPMVGDDPYWGYPYTTTWQ